MDERPLVSIGVATYNGAASLESTLRSLENQTYDNLEVIISDDGSDDTTESIALAFSDRNPSWTFRHNSGSRGMLGNYQGLLTSASGSLFCFVDQDDRRDPSFISNAVDKFSERSDLSGVLTNIRVVWSPEALSDPNLIVQVNHIPAGLASVHSLQRLWTLLRRFSDIWLYGLYRTEDLRVAFRESHPTPVFPALVLTSIALRGPIGSCSQSLIEYTAKGSKRRTSPTEDSHRVMRTQSVTRWVPYLVDQAFGQFRICLSSRQLTLYLRLIACGLVVANLGASVCSRAARRAAIRFDRPGVWAIADGIAELAHPHDHIHFPYDPIEISYLAKGWRAN